MSRRDASPAWDTDGEVASLIETLHATGRRLEELTDGEVDAVADRHGHTFVLRRAQEQLRHFETAKQAALLNALPAHIALLDAHGVIVSVNEAWRQFAGANGMPGTGSAVGASYLGVCDAASGEGASEARQAAEGIRRVLRGTAKRFSLEYPCHSPDEQRWFRMIATPLAGGPPTGVIVMHLDLSAERQALRESERRFSDLLDNVQLASVMLDRDARITYCNEYLLRLSGWRNEDVIGRGWFDLFMPPGSEGLHALFADLIANRPQAWHNESEIVTRSGERRLFRWNNSVLRSNAGDVIGTASIGEDITDRSRFEATLKQNQERTRSIVESSLDAVVVMDARGRVVDWNSQAERTFGWSREQVVGKPVSETIIPARYRAAHDEGMRVFLETGAGPVFNQRIEISAMHRDGHEFPVELAIAPVEVEGAWMFSAFIRDLTASKESETRIRRLNRVHAVLSAINTLIVRVGDRDELFREANRVAIEDGKFRMAWIGMADRETGRITPIASAGDVGDFLASARLDLRPGDASGFGLSGRAMQELQPMVSNDVGNDPERTNKEQMAARGIHSVAVIPLIIAGEAVGVLALYAADVGFFDDAEMRLLLELAGNISFAIDHIHKRELLDHLAYYDALTGVANRSLFLDRVTQYVNSAASGGHELAVYLIDLERFKNLNDGLGRPAGDALLRQVAEWLTRHVGDANLVARVGADEFAVVLPQVLPGEVSGTVGKSLEAFLEHPFRLNDSVFRIAAKAGVALFPQDGAAADTLFRNAEAALKKAKATGERCLSYTQAMNETVAGKLTLENQLRQALDQGQFVLHYQPKVSLATGKLTGAEALIRWNDPRTGLVPPGRFIPVLEETGLIYDVGRWALRQAIADYLRWRTMGLDALRIAVNVSPLQLRNRGFIAELGQAVGIDPHAAAGVEIEITESVIMEDAKHSIASLQAIRAMGLTVAIDDFGTGFSSLSYLAKLPVDTLKIDRSFVVDMTASSQGLALVSTIINLAHSLKLKVVAEGVETDEQSRLLRLLDCDEMQGFLFGRPVACDVFEKTYLSA